MLWPFKNIKDKFVGCQSRDIILLLEEMTIEFLFGIFENNSASMS